MTDLTDKWKAGELEDGFYYTQTSKDKIIAIDMYDKESNAWLLNSDKDMPPFEVLAPVPSYEELQELKAQLAEHKEYCCCAKNEVLVLENARQKELLKECQTRITDCLYKIYDEGGHSYPSLEEELKVSLSKLRRY